MPRALLLLALVSCRADPSPVAAVAVAPVVVRDAGVAVEVVVGGLPAHQRFEDLPAALRAVVPAGTRVLGVGELHARVDRAAVRSALSAFTEVVPVFGAQISDVVVETWIVDPSCGAVAQTTTRKLETAVRRPAATKSEIALLADAARAAGAQPHAMTLSCKDYASLTAAGGEPDPVAMLGLTTRELSRIAVSAVRYRDRQRGPRPWIVVYGGALHNDRFPATGVAEWSYAEALDLATDGHYLELDLIVPELAAADPSSRTQPWFPLVAAASPRGVLVWSRGERSLVVILPRGSSPVPAPAPAAP